jgi:hypothetical protein
MKSGGDVPIRDWSTSSALPLEELDGAFVLFGRFPGTGF